PIWGRGANGALNPALGNAGAVVCDARLEQVMRHTCGESAPVSTRIVYRVRSRLCGRPDFRGVDRFGGDRLHTRQGMSKTILAEPRRGNVIKGALVAIHILLSYTILTIFSIHKRRAAKVAHFIS